MECPNCHHWNETSSRFCEECGFELSGMAADNPLPTSVKIDSDVVPDPIPQTLIQPDPPNKVAVHGGAHFVLNTTGSIFKLGALTVIGREDPTLQIDFDGYPGGQYISHRHAQISQNDGAFYIEDLGSSNHTYVNNTRLAVGQSQPLHEGDKVRLGKIELLFHEK